MKGTMELVNSGVATVSSMCVCYVTFKLLYYYNAAGKQFGMWF